jgi:4-methylaminobutanoate oxidase (formaldehyde-forming)
MIESGEPVDQAYLDAGKWEVEIAGKLYPAIVSLKPLYDPEMKKIKA